MKKDEQRKKNAGKERKGENKKSKKLKKREERKAHTPKWKRKRKIPRKGKRGGEENKKARLKYLKCGRRRRRRRQTKRK